MGEVQVRPPQSVYHGLFQTQERVGTQEEPPDGSVVLGFLIEALYQEDFPGTKLDDPRLWDGDPTFVGEAQVGSFNDGVVPPVASGRELRHPQLAVSVHDDCLRPRPAHRATGREHAIEVCQQRVLLPLYLALERVSRITCCFQVVQRMNVGIVQRRHLLAGAVAQRADPKVRRSK